MPGVGSGRDDEASHHRRPEDDLAYVMGVMTKNRIRHLPIMDFEELTGIISIGDVVNAHVEETAFENRMLKDYIQGVTH